MILSDFFKPDHQKEPFSAKETVPFGLTRIKIPAIF
jgi:hypothetical protein